MATAAANANGGLLGAFTPNLPILQSGFWLRFGVVTLGVALIVAALFMITATSKTVQVVAKKAIKTTPQGALIDGAVSAIG